jgi:hypothetical protein
MLCSPLFASKLHTDYEPPTVLRRGQSMHRLVSRAWHPPLVMRIKHHQQPKRTLWEANMNAGCIDLYPKGRPASRGRSFDHDPSSRRRAALLPIAEADLKYPTTVATDVCPVSAIVSPIGTPW